MSTVKKSLSFLYKWKEFIALLVFWQAILSAPFSVDLAVSYSSNDFFVPLPIAQVGENTKLLDVVLTNESDSSISNIELTINGIKEVHFIGYMSSSRRLEDSYGETIDYELSENNSLYLEEVEEIAAGHNVQVQVLAETTRVLFGQVIDVTADSGSIQISSVAKVSGFWGFLSSYSSFIVICFAMGAFVLGLTRMKVEK